MDNYYGKLFTTKDCKACTKARKMLTEASIIPDKRIEIVDISDSFGAKMASIFSINSLPAFAIYRVIDGVNIDIDTSMNPCTLDGINDIKLYFTEG